jgi:hypothetical protein
VNVDITYNQKQVSITTPGENTVSAGTNFLVTLSNIMWSEITTSSSASANRGYICNSGAEITVTLPSTIEVGDLIAVAGKGAGGWKIAQRAGQTIHFGSVDSTTGVGGYIEFTNRYDFIYLLCITANTDFVAFGVQGNLTII